MRKIGKTQKDLIPTNMKMMNFTRGATVAMGVLVAKITVGLKTMYSTSFIVDAKPAYSVLMGRDWIHASQRVPSMLHQQLLFLGRRPCKYHVN